jgi:hypothetical protein
MTMNNAQLQLEHLWDDKVALDMTEPEKLL